MNESPRHGQGVDFETQRLGLYRDLFARTTSTGRSSSAVLAALIDAWPDKVGLEGLAEAVWPDPHHRAMIEHPDTTLRVIISRLRRDLRPLGWTIPPIHGGRHARDRRYGLERICAP